MEKGGFPRGSQIDLHRFISICCIRHKDPKAPRNRSIMFLLVSSFPGGKTRSVASDRCMSVYVFPGMKDAILRHPLVSAR